MSLRFNSEKKPVVLDIGHRSIKAGFAGEGSPRCIQATPPAVQHLLGYLVSSPTSTLSPTVPKAAEQAISILLRYIFFEQLLIKPPEHRLVICQHQDTPHSFQKILTQVVFSLFRTPSVLLRSCSSFALQCAGCTSGLVVDVGSRETRVCPYVFGVPLEHASTTAAVGYRSLEGYLQRRLEAQWTLAGHAMSELTPHMEGLVRKACRVVSQQDAIAARQSIQSIQSLQSLQSLQSRQSGQSGQSAMGMETSPPLPVVPDLPYKFDECELTVRGIDRILAPELLFGTAMGGGAREGKGNIVAVGEEQESSVLTAIVDALMRCNRDCRLHAARNIILVGGTAGLPGFHARLLEELHSLAQVAADSANADDRMKDHPTRKALVCLLNCHVVQMPCAPQVVAWTGGSIVGSVDDLKDLSMSLKEWTDGKQVVDQSALPVGGDDL